MGRHRRDKARRRGGGGQREERLARLVGELTADPGYGMGEKPFPGRVDPEDAIAIVEALQAELDEGAAARAEIAAARGMPIACARGCNHCCEEVVVVDRPEALAVARWLDRPENAGARAGFLAAYPAWAARVGEAGERLAALSERRAERAAYEALHRELWRARVMCAFNRDGDCAIYPVRPLVCRDAHAVETRERCAATSLVPATRLTYGPVADFLPRAAFLVRAAHHGLDGEKRAEPLCGAVHRLLVAGPRQTP